MNESKIIPPEIQDKLLALRDQITNIAWQVGDLCKEVIQYNELNNTGAAKMDIYKSVASMVGKESRTVRDYYDTAERFDLHQREQFDTLAFGHFRIAARTNNPEAALQWAMDQVEATGKPATIDAMKKMYGNIVAPGVDDTEVLVAYPGKIRDLIDKYRENIPQNIIERVWKETGDLEIALKEVVDFINKAYNQN